MNSSQSEPCSFALQLVSLRLGSPWTSFTSFCCSSTARCAVWFLDTPLCFTRFVSFLATSQACRLFAICSKSTCSKWNDFLSVLCRWPSAPAILLADGMRFLFMRARKSSQHLLEFSFPLSRRIPSRTTPVYVMFFVLWNSSLQSTWILQRSVTVCCPSVVSVSHPFSMRHLSIPELQFPLQSRLGVLLLSRQHSILVLLPCVDDFQYPRPSSSVHLLSSRHCSPRTSRLQLALLFQFC